MGLSGDQTRTVVNALATIAGAFAAYIEAQVGQASVEKWIGKVKA